MTELIGDSTREGRWSLVRLAVEDDTIVSAEAEGLERPLEGLSLLEAAAVGGDELAVDALANALAPAFRAAPKPGRVAVAMSGGVDSAVALLRAGPGAIGVTLRLWLDPQGPDAERACCSPEAVLAARATCHRLGLPHVTLDLREEFRRAVVEPFVRGYAAGRTPNPCMRCNGSFRFAELLAFAERAGAERLATGHYARIVEHRGRLLLARAADGAKDQSYMLARLDPRFLEKLWFPLGEQSKDETRAEAARAGLEAASRAESQEACFLAGGDYREFLERHGLEAAEGTIVDEDGAAVGRHTGFWRFTPGQRRGLRVATGEPRLCAPQRAADEHGRRRAPFGARDARGPGAWTAPPRGSARRGEVALSLARSGRRRGRRGRRLPALARRSGLRGCCRAGGGPLRGRCCRGRRHDHGGSCRNLMRPSPVRTHGRMTGDEITLTIPRDASFHEVAHLVLGGVAARLNLSFESLDDLETALDAALERGAESSEVTVKLRIAEGAIVARVGPFASASLRAELEQDPDESMSLRRVLDTVVDGYRLDSEGWLELTKSVEQQEEAAT